MAKERKFEYVYNDSSGKKKKGKIETTSTERAYQLLRSEGITPLKVTDLDNDVMQKEIVIPGFEPKAKLKALAIFCRQFSLMIRAGIPILEALEVSAEQTEDKVLKKALAEVHKDVESGLSLSASMGKHSKAFPNLLVAIVEVGEDGGFLDESLNSMARIYKTELELKQKVRGAMIYPIVVLSITLLVLTGMLIFVVPMFEEMFASLDAELPMITQILVSISKNMAIIVPIFLVIVGILIFLYRKFKDEEWLRSRVDRMKLKVPVFGNLTTKVAVARFTSNLGMMLAAGVPLIRSLQLVSKTADNWVISNAVNEAVAGMENGKSFSASIDRFEMFPDMVKNMVVVGERSGTMPTMLATVAEFYDDEVREASESLTSAIEPLLIVVLGVLVGGMLLALYTPMFTMVTTMSEV